MTLMTKIKIALRFQVKVIKLTTGIEEKKDFNAKNALVPSTRIRDLKSKKDYNCLGLKEHSQVQIILTNIILS